MINPAIENDLKNMSLNDVNYADYIKENYIQIPDNATNGDIIKAVFPDIRTEDSEYEDSVVVFDLDNKVESGMFFYKDWWNSPYKEDKEGD